jgi:riboflavin kinase/FMN adenylyltransferase
MFERPAPNLETFLFDFAGDLYEQHLSVGLVEFLRPEMDFATLDALVEQMDTDSAAARKALAAA